MKQFKGVITSWDLRENRIHGVCVHHTTYDNGIAKDMAIITSEVVSIKRAPFSHAKECETKNSIYILI